MTGEYKNFFELECNETDGEDYTILHRRADSPVAVVAPHGGGIELGTVDIADAIAGRDHSFYAFKAIKKTGNAKLHISSNRYDEPLGVMMSQAADIVVSIHGWRDQREMVLVGGRHQELKQKIVAGLRHAGFAAEISTLKGYRGSRPENICNRCRGEKGVQLEISRGLREKMFSNLGRRSLRGKTRLFYKFVNQIRKSIKTFNTRESDHDF